MGRPSAKDDSSGVFLRILSAVLLIVLVVLFFVPHLRERPVEVVVLTGVLLAAAVAAVAVVPSDLVFLIPPAILIGGATPALLYVLVQLPAPRVELLGRLMPAMRVAAAIASGTLVTLIYILSLVYWYTNRYCVEAMLTISPLDHLLGRRRRDTPPRWERALEELWERGLGSLVKVELVELVIISCAWGAAALPVAQGWLKSVAELLPGLGLYDVTEELGGFHTMYIVVLGLGGTVASIYDLSKIHSIIQTYVSWKCLYQIVKTKLKSEDRACVFVSALDPADESIDTLRIQINCRISSEAETFDVLHTTLKDVDIIGQLRSKNFLDHICRSGRKVREFLVKYERCMKGRSSSQADVDIEQLKQLWSCRWHQRVWHKLTGGATVFLAPLIFVPAILLVI